MIEQFTAEIISYLNIQFNMKMTSGNFNNNNKKSQQQNKYIFIVYLNVI